MSENNWKLVSCGAIEDGGYYLVRWWFGSTMYVEVVDWLADTPYHGRVSDDCTPSVIII